MPARPTPSSANDGGSGTSPVGAVSADTSATNPSTLSVTLDVSVNVKVVVVASAVKE
jgi:hypothetical protein